MAGRSLAALRELIADRPLPVTSLHRVVGPDRTLALIRGSLQQIKDVAAAYNSTVNDVLLAVIAGGLRGLLSSRGEPVDGVMVRLGVELRVDLDRINRSFMTNSPFSLVTLASRRTLPVT